MLADSIGPTYNPVTGFHCLEDLAAGVPFDADVAKFSQTISKCGYKFTHALEPVRN